MGLERPAGSGPIADRTGTIITAAPPPGIKGVRVERKRVLMTRTERGKDEPATEPLRTYEAGAHYSLGPTLYDAFVNHLGCAVDAPEEEETAGIPSPSTPLEPPPPGEPVIPGETQKQPPRETQTRGHGRQTKPARKKG